MLVFETLKNKSFDFLNSYTCFCSKLYGNWKELIFETTYFILQQSDTKVISKRTNTISNTFLFSGQCVIRICCNIQLDSYAPSLKLKKDKFDKCFGFLSVLFLCKKSFQKYIQCAIIITCLVAIKTWDTRVP